MEEEEHEVYGGEIPDEGEMEADADVDMTGADDDAAAKVFRNSIFFERKFAQICVWFSSFMNVRELD